MIKKVFINNDIVMLTAHSSQLHYYSLTINSIIAIFYAFSYACNFKIISRLFTVIYIIIVNFVSIFNYYDIHKYLTKNNNDYKTTKEKQKFKITLRSR